MISINAESFESDLRRLIDKIVVTHPISPNSHLGDIIQDMGRKKLLLVRLKDDNFGINESINISDTSRDYLNLLQTEKLSACRLCYHRNDDNRCEFHKKYVNIDMPNSGDDYDQFLNSDMGIISFVELYYTYLGMDFWRPTAVFLFRDLTGFSSIKEMMMHYNHPFENDVDSVPVESMDCE
jgi:hypothetical protein